MSQAKVFTPSQKQTLLTIVKLGDQAYKIAILDSLPYVTTCTSIDFTLNSLLKRGYIVKADYSVPQNSTKNQKQVRFLATDSGKAVAKTLELKVSFDDIQII